MSKRSWAILAGIAALLLAYAVWPVIGLKLIADAVQARDAAALADRIDRPELKRSLGEQLARAYLRATGRDKGLSPFALALAMQVGTAVADPIIDQMLQPEALIELLQQGGAETFAGKNLGVQGWDAPNLGNLRGLIRSTEYSGRTFYVTVPLQADEDTGYRLKLRLSGWTWKLAGIGLPQQMQDRIAQEIAKKNPP